MFLGYELAQEIEPQLALPRSPLPWQAFALRTPCALVHDLERQRVFAVAEAHAADALARIAAEAHEAAREQQFCDTLRIEQVQEEDPRAYLERVRRAKEYVRAGDIYQANLSRPWEVQIRGSAAHPQMAPAAALSTGVRCSPEKPSTCPTLPRTDAASPESTMTSWPGTSRPRRMRPIPIRPT